jgi:HPt (histidine-containing phosphotransfer) domain-containing protein
MPDTNNTFVSKIPPLEGVNIAENVMRFGSDEAYLSILSSFVRQTPQTLNDMRTPSEANLDLYAIKVHGLKGASYGIGANVVGDAAFELEKAAKAGDIAFVLEKNDAFIRQTETLLQNISRLLETAGGSAPGQKPRLLKPSRALLEQIRSAASRYKSSELEALVKELSAAEYEVDGGLVTWLQEAADNLDYDAIVERLKTEGI